MNTQQMTLRLLGAIGASVFLTFFAFTYSVPGWVEKVGADFIESEVSKKIDTTINMLQPPEGSGAIGKVASALYAKNEKKIEELKAALKTKAHEKMAEAITEARNLDCECRKKIAQRLETGFVFDLALLQAANDRITEFVQTRYMEVSIELKRDIRIFTGSNAFVFLLLLLVSFMKPKAIVHLFLPGVLLFAATIICSYFYIFEQNWLLTIIYSNYLGFMYLGYVGIVFLFLCDIAFNDARVTTEVLNAVFNAIGSAMSVAPC